MREQSANPCAAGNLRPRALRAAAFVCAAAIPALPACGSAGKGSQAEFRGTAAATDASAAIDACVTCADARSSDHPDDSGSHGDGSPESGDGDSGNGESGSPRIDAGFTSGGSDGGSSTPVGEAGSSFVFTPYKDTSINLNWNTNVVSTSVSGSASALANDLVQHGGKAITLAFATGECGSENWAGVAGADMATANVPLLVQAGIQYIISTGGAAGTFTCGSDSGFATFIGRWASPNLIGVDFDIEGGQTTSDITALVQRIQAAHVTFPKLRFSLTIATLATSIPGAMTAQSQATNAQDSLNTLGDQVMATVKGILGFSGAASTWPAFLTVDLMTMDYGSANAGNCVVSGSTCDMGQSAVQAAYNLHDHWGVPYGNIELTPMLGGNDVSSEQFTLADADIVAGFAIANGIAGVHYWSYDRDRDCAAGSASPTCNSMGVGYAGAYGYLTRFLQNGLR